MKASDYLREHERRNQATDDKDDRKEHTLQENARERAEHPEKLNAGTPYDWQDVESYREELERMDKEGPRRHADNREQEKKSGESQ